MEDEDIYYDDMPSCMTCANCIDNFCFAKMCPTFDLMGMSQSELNECYVEFID